MFYKICFYKQTNNKQNKTKNKTTDQDPVVSKIFDLFSKTNKKITKWMNKFLQITQIMFVL